MKKHVLHLGREVAPVLLAATVGLASVLGVGCGRITSPDPTGTVLQQRDPAPLAGTRTIVVSTLAENQAPWPLIIYPIDGRPGIYINPGTSVTFSQVGSGNFTAVYLNYRLSVAPPLHFVTSISFTAHVQLYRTAPGIFAARYL